MEAINLKPSVTPIFNLLKLTFGIVPVVAGIDKFTILLTHWENYVSPGVANILPIAPHTFMMIAGVIEIIAGVLVLAKPVIGRYAVAAWLTVIALTLLASGNYPDVAVRDMVIALGAFSLAKLAQIIMPVKNKLVI